MDRILSVIAALLTMMAFATTAQAQAGRGCSMFKPCPGGYSCMPFRQKCHRDSGARAGEPCQAGYGCARGFRCEAGSQVCRGPGKLGDPCHLTRPCGKGLTCEAGSHKCRRPGREGESCHLTRPCGKGLTCEAGSHKCRKPGRLGDPCHATRPCGSGLNCQPGVHKCYHVPRKPGEPCSAGYGCQKGFYCQPFVHKCVPRTVNYNSNSPCGSLRLQSAAEDAKRANITMSFSAGSTAGAGPYFSYETGLVYGNKGQFGCFVTACIGSQADASIANFAAFGLYRSFKDFEGFSMVTGGGVDVPFIELGFQTSQVWRSTPPKSARDFAKNGLLGSVSSLSFGVGLNPVSVSSAMCYTEVLDDGQPLTLFKNIKGLLKAWGADGFAPERKPSGVGKQVGRTTRPSSSTSTPAGFRRTTNRPTTVNRPTGPTTVSRLPAGYRKCANERGQCRFRGALDVYYGAKNKWVRKRASNGVACNNAVFGDPIHGVAKACFIKGSPETPPLARFSRTPNGAISGHNNQRLRGVSPADCARSCLGQRWCASFDYHRSERWCDLSDKHAGQVGGLKRYSGSPYDHYSRR